MPTMTSSVKNTFLEIHFMRRAGLRVVVIGKRTFVAPSVNLGIMDYTHTFYIFLKNGFPKFILNEGATVI